MSEPLLGQGSPSIFPPVWLLDEKKPSTCAWCRSVLMTGEDAGGYHVFGFLIPHGPIVCHPCFKMWIKSGLCQKVIEPKYHRLFNDFICYGNHFLRIGRMPRYLVIAREDVALFSVRNGGLKIGRWYIRLRIRKV